MSDELVEIECPGSEDGPRTIALADFLRIYGADLLRSVGQQNPPVYDGRADPERERQMHGLRRKPLPAQADAVQAVMRLLVDAGAPAAIINGEMGTGKTMMGIMAGALLHAAGYPRTLVIAPPHLVYKWRREILETVPRARVWVLNGPDALRKLLKLRDMQATPDVPEYFVLGRVRMRLGFNWKPVFVTRKFLRRDELGRQVVDYAACPRCGSVIYGDDGEPLAPQVAASVLAQNRRSCNARPEPDQPVCGEALWSLVGPGRSGKPARQMVLDALQQIPTIGAKTAERLLQRFGEEVLSGMLADNVYQFVNLMDGDGELVFSDRQARRMERALATAEFAFGQGGYQATEFIKRYLPQGYFGLLVVDEGHEYKNEGSAQGQAMGVLARKCSKKLLLTGTLMGGYADDLFYLLYRLDPRMMIEDGFNYSRSNSLGPAAMAWLREHGVLKDVFKDGEKSSHRTARAVIQTRRTSKAPGFGPKGIMRAVLPITAFVKLRDMGADTLPPYDEVFEEVQMTEAQAYAYRKLADSLQHQLRQALVRGDTTLLGVVLNVLLAWPDCCFRDELVKHPRTRDTLASVPAIFGDEAMPKEARLIDLCREEWQRGRRVLVYSTYTGTRDTTARLKGLLDKAGFKTAVLRASVDASQREDWLADQVERGVQVLITNPELVKTGLDLLDFPTIVFMQSGYNVYTLQQASRRSWRIGQTQPVRVVFLGFAGSAQMACLQLMAKKIAVSQSTSGDMPESGLDVLNQGGESVEVALARQLLAA